MAARIGGAVAAVVALGFLVWIAVLSFGPESVVAPTVSISVVSSPQRTAQTSGSNASGEPSVSDVLAARTRLMDDRTTTGANAFPKFSSGDFQLRATPVAPEPIKTVQWESNRPGDDMLRERGNISGTSSLPYAEAQVFQQPGGRDWRRIHNDQVRYGGGWLLFGMLFALGAFLAFRGRIKIVEGWSGKTVERFGAFERANHWMTAISFVGMALTGLIITYGKPLLIPLFGESAFGSVASWSAWLHMALAVPFVLGILIMIGLWLVDNIPDKLDWEWLKRGGGLLRDDGKNPPARKFNAGQKLIFWGVVIGGLLLLASGITLMFPFYWFGYDGMQTAQIVHAVLALAMIALIFGHIYIGTIGMQGAFEAMWSGQVDRNWAKEHHRIWYDRISGRDRASPAEGPSSSTAAE